MSISPVTKAAKVLILWVAAATALHAGRVTGKVLDAAGQPVEGAYIQVLAQTGSGGPFTGAQPDIVAQTQSDGNGRYALDAPGGLLVFGVNAPGYYVISAGGVESESITKTCPEQGDCGEVDFRLGKNAVVEGWVTDRFGDPVSGVPMSLRDADSPATPRPGQGPVRMPRFTDDRGYFRIWGLRPGEYILEKESRVRAFPMLGASIDFPPRKIKISDQAEVVELRISTSSEQGGHSISGTIEGASDRAMIQAARYEGGVASIVTYHPMREGRFSINGLATGDYVLRLAEYNPEKPMSQRVRVLAELRVDRDMNDLRLAPQPPSGVRLTVDFGSLEKSNLFVRLEPQGSGSADIIVLQGPDYEATNEGLLPGEYNLLLFSEDYYLAAPGRIAVSAGQITPYTLKIGNEFASLRGRVRVAEGAERAGAAHFTVGVRGPQRRQKMQTDEDGRFAFDKLAPGDYVVAAWQKPDVDVENDDVWKDAAGSVNNVALEPGFDVEINLTATP